MSDQKLATPRALSSFNWQVGVHMLMHESTVVGRSSTAWGTANLAIFIPVPCDGPFTIRRLGWENGNTLGANVDMGVYTSEGKLVISTGSTAQSGAGLWQTVDVTDTLIPPGLYYLALVLSNTTGQIAAPGHSLNIQRAVGVYEMASAFPLPSSATLATRATSTLWPSMQAFAVDVA